MWLFERYHLSPNKGMGTMQKNTTMKFDFIRSSVTTSKYFNDVLGAICSSRYLLVKQLDGSLHP